MDNIVIKATTKADAEYALAYFSARGVNLRHYEGSTSNEEDGYFCHYYGVVNGVFGLYDVSEINECHVLKTNS